MQNSIHASPFPFDLTGLHLAPGKGLAVQLYQSLRDRILKGQIDRQVKLPTTRELALALSISRTTVVRAYDQLYAEGYISARVGDGTYVSAPASDIARTPAAGKTDIAPRLSELGQRMALPAKVMPPPGKPRTFRIGVPALDLFPGDVWARLQADFWRRGIENRIGYSDPAGDPQLREMLAGYLRNSRGLICDPDQIIITAGTQQALFMCAQLLLNPGDTAAMENPGYPRAASALTLNGGKVVGIGVDAEGIITQELQAHPDVRLAYVTPSHQYPSGVTLSLARRLELLAWAEANQSYILEDDYDGEYRYSGTPLALLASLDRSGRVLHMGTFSKIAFPGLRLGYIVAPPALATPLINLRMQYDRHSSVSEQAVMAEFMAQGHFQRHVRRMRRASRARRDAMVDGWQHHQPGGISLPEIDAGLHCSVRVPTIRQQDDMIRRAAEAGIEIEGLTRYWLPGSARQHEAGLVMGFGGADEAAISAAIKTLAKIWR